MHCLRQDERLATKCWSLKSSNVRVHNGSCRIYLLAICHDCKSKRQQQHPKFPFKPPHCNASHLAPSGYWPVWVKLQGNTFWHITAIALQIVSFHHFNIFQLTWIHDFKMFQVSENNTKMYKNHLRHQISLLGVGLRHHHLQYQIARLKLRIWENWVHVFYINFCTENCTHLTRNFWKSVPGPLALDHLTWESAWRCQWGRDEIFIWICPILSSEIGNIQELCNVCNIPVSIAAFTGW